MKKRIQTLALCFLALALAPHSLLAQEYSVGQGSQFALQAELIYFKTVTDHTGFVGKNTQLYPIISEKRYINDPSFKPGFRLEGDWYACNCINQFQARYTYLHNGNQAPRVTGALVSTFPGAGTLASNFGTATSRVSINYNAGDLVWGRSLLSCCDFDFNFLAGLHMTYLSYKERVRLESGTFVLKNRWNSSFWGIGPEAGFTAHYALPCFCNLRLVGDLRGALLAGNTRARFNLRGNTFQTLKGSNSPGQFGAFPLFDGRLGVNYAWGCSCFNTDFELGYEMIWYSRVIDKIVFNQVSALFTTDLYSDLRMHGPYAAVRFIF